MAKCHGFKLWLETDAEVLCSLLEKRQMGPSDTRHAMAEIIMELRGIQWKIRILEEKKTRWQIA